MDNAPAWAPAGLPAREYLLVLLTAAAVTFLLTGLVRLLAMRVGAVAYPRKRDVHVKPIPRMGGVAMYGGVLAAMFLADNLPALSRGFDYSKDAVAVIVAGGLIVLVGALDDRFELDSLTKLAGQVTAAGILVLSGVQWYMIGVPWGGGEDQLGQIVVLGSNQGQLLTVLLIVAMVNAMNFVDGLDGLASGIGLIAASATSVFCLGLLAKHGGDVTAYPPALIAATIAGACLGFLPFNFQPAKIFMGDSGSMLIGLMLATASTTASGKLDINTAELKDTIALLSPLLVVAAVLFVPLLDLSLAVVRRTRAGKSPFHADKMHLHHRLLEIGHSQRRAVLLIYLWASVIAFGAVSLTLFNAVVVAWVVGLGVLVAAIISVVPRMRARAAERESQRES
ncbi:UDP-GlcNAc:undecaprenyl-phosphate GlcNAc-1-phosphate transferase [Saccharopolyspora erythraea NRRL 2338]|uniref:Undecaprenyl-phosphate alpha-N-acetylglucosaminyltransferase n=2 Tax=Saccharopolyspora erythraea TaxID=1836 RepID=A4FN35_SACEN|nr:MraY family glycosyltransferase [Saccharopolyspora erythraea]EQD81716.1 UDP-phosphate alpha-N-acetylglucosaminyl 1-phosphate transferase [Saccharopolyspora erythraea D]PFG99101.1 UDP-GlcNAc:undecaprenyl-phosphate GlcNAc-1-phosphate transferase [Saccharopolyspora erythraea NRRL 2338]QRK89061.1 undecaprenyl/decaprenyl-phosphate alpha-N-acetylglucosaminyl 1-phosphate transferase [Saccharopolyspora erythraea]CAM05460.1 undecaprenyl-phosphate alpha-N-acetylglucosaminyltransferase [Saccharopolyspo